MGTGSIRYRGRRATVLPQAGISALHGGRRPVGGGHPQPAPPPADGEYDISQKEKATNSPSHVHPLSQGFLWGIGMIQESLGITRLLCRR